MPVPLSFLPLSFPLRFARGVPVLLSFFPILRFLDLLLALDVLWLYPLSVILNFLAVLLWQGWDWPLSLFTPFLW